MSRFDAQCQECQTEFEYEGSYKDVVPPCLTCASHKTVRILATVPAYSLKGSGWYKDGYSVTSRGADSVGAKADRHGKAVSFPGQKVRG